VKSPTTTSARHQSAIAPSFKIEILAQSMNEVDCEDGPS
jgi:hypothetical protein